MRVFSQILVLIYFSIWTGFKFNAFRLYSFGFNLFYLFLSFCWRGLLSIIYLSKVFKYWVNLFWYSYPRSNLYLELVCLIFLHDEIFPQRKIQATFTRTLQELKIIEKRGWLMPESDPFACVDVRRLQTLVRKIIDF